MNAPTTHQPFALKTRVRVSTSALRILAAVAAAAAIALLVLISVPIGTGRHAFFIHVGVLVTGMVLSLVGGIVVATRLPIWLLVRK